MPVAIVKRPGNVSPGLYRADSAEQLLTKLSTLDSAPALADEAAARAWLADLGEPSGWFESYEDAVAGIRGMAPPPPATDIGAIRKEIGIEAAVFGKALGIQGDDAAVAAEVERMESGEAEVSKEHLRRAQGMLAALVRTRKGG